MSSMVRHTLERLESSAFDADLARCYGPSKLDNSRTRVRMLLGRFAEAFPEAEGPLRIVSSPGRTELGGNHTDHNHGRVLAAAIHLDCLAAMVPADDDLVMIYSDGYPHPVVVRLDDTKPKSDETGTPQALVRGAAHALQEAGIPVSGFRAVVHSTVPEGAGLSSSAAFGVLAARLFSLAAAEELAPPELDPLQLARAARTAENLHFGKPCGFMDQTASACMGVMSIDFKDPDHPAVEHVDTDLSELGHVLCVVATGCSHEDLTPDYAAIREEMTRAARALGQEAARGLTMAQVLEGASAVRQAAGDRGVLRLMHFIEEDRRAALMAESLRLGDVPGFLRQVNLSGFSSWRLLQNCWSPSRPLEQRIPLALSLSERLMNGRGASRVHGGGFAGTMQAFVPEGGFEKFRTAMEEVFGTGSVIPLRVRTPDDGIIRSQDEGEEA